MGNRKMPNTHRTEALNSKNFELDPTHMGPQNLEKKNPKK
jgi:hypothetical protein